MTAVDLFAGGARGWSVAAERLGLGPTIGVEIDPVACRTAVAAGHLTVCADVETYPLDQFTRVHGICGSPPCQDFSVAGRRKGVAGETGRLVYEPVRWALALRPLWVCLEQVPEVEPIWRLESLKLIGAGYQTWVGILDAADYGVPQNRKRAVLLASRVRRVGCPRPTHAEHPNPEVPLFGEPDDRLPWVSMAEALGVPADFAVENIRGAGMVQRSGDRRWHPASEPAPTVTASNRENKWLLHTGNNSMVTSRRGSRAGDGGVQPYVRRIGRPAPVVDTKAHSAWTLTRPATTVQGTPRVAPPGHHDRQWNDSVKVQLHELGVLQGFPADYPWQGNKTERARQIGNAIPPQLARACVAEVTGLAHIEGAAA